MRRAETAPIRYRALGPLTVEVDGSPLKLGGLRQQMVLAILLNNANHVVSQDGLIDSVWAGEPPDAARATVQTYIYNLRKSLGPEAITRRGDGYMVEADARSFDVLFFEESLEQGRSLLEADPRSAKASMMAGLDVWFGTAYGGVDHPELIAEIQRLGEMRVNALETRIEADLALGHAGSVVGELETLVRDYPLRERFWAQLMLALYGSGRQAEALRTFQQARSRLIDELGIEPGVELQNLEERILGQDPSLLVATPESADASAPGSGGETRTIRGYELRQPVGEGELGIVYRAYQPSVGREVAVKVVRSEHGNDPAFVRSFEREAQIVASLEHPHIIPLFDYWRDPEGAYLVMPLMRGEDLATSLSVGRWRLEPTLRLLDQVGGALSHAHRRGVLHRHLKSSNVLLDEDGNAYLSDFGIVTRPAAADSGGSAGFVPPEALAGDRYTIRSDIFGLGAVTFHLLTGVPPPPEVAFHDLDESLDGLPAGLAAVVGRAMAADPDDRFDRVDDYLRDLRRAAGVDVVAGSDLAEAPVEPVRNPYKGLRAFGEEDAADFHGRAALVDDLLERVAARRLVAVVGPSGSGKSSLVRAGLIPALRAGGVPGSRNWLVTDMFPGSYPFEELEAALTRVAVDRPEGLLPELTEPNGLLRVSKQILPDDESTLLLVVDQFEELFSTVRSEEVRRLFLANLIAVASDERSRVKVLVTVRADFLDRPLGYGDFAEAMADGIVTVGPPTREGLAQAIAAPARTVGLELEAGLAGRMTNDVLGQPGALPLLQYALTEMFTRRQGPTLTIAGYEETGGVAGALGRRAEELYEGLSPSGKEAARQIFLRLVSVDGLASNTRRRARQSELLSLDADRSGVEAVLNAFAGFRLLTFDRDPVTRGPTVEVAHEALLTEWERLEGWIDDARGSLVLARRLVESAEEWNESGRDPSYLLRGARLDELEEWSSDGVVALTANESEFIEASIDEREEELADSRRRRRRIVVSLTAGLVVVSVLAVLALIQREAAEREALASRVRELAVASSSHIEENPELALLVATEAFDQSAQGGLEPIPYEAVSAIARAVHDWRLLARFPAGDERIAVASPDGSLFATSVGPRPSTTVNLSDATGAVIRALEGPDHPDVNASAAAFNPDGSMIAVSYVAIEGMGYASAPEEVPGVVIFDADSGSVVSSFDVDGVLYGLDFSPSGDLLAVSSHRDVHVIELETGTELGRFSVSSNMGQATFLDETTFLNDQSLLVTVDGEGVAIHAIDGSLLNEFSDRDLTYYTAMDPTGTRVAYVAGDQIRVMETEDGEIVYTEDAGFGIAGLALDSGGTRLAYSGFDPNIYVVPVDGEGERMQLSGSLGNVAALSFVGGDRLLSHADGALLWDVSADGSDDLSVLSLSEPQSGFRISPDGSQLAQWVNANYLSGTGHPNDGLRLFDVETQEQILSQEGELLGGVPGLRWPSPDLSMVGSLTLEGRSTVRLLPTWDVVREFEDCRAPVAFTPDSTRVLLSGWVCAVELAGDPAHSEVIDLLTGDSILTLPFRWVEGEFNPDGAFAGGRYLALTDQQIVELWDVEDGEMLWSLEASDVNETNLFGVTFDSTGRYLVGGTEGGTVWGADMDLIVAGADVAEAIVFREQAHTGAAPLPAVNADGIVATAGFDNVVRLWDFHSGRLLFEFEADLGAPDIRFSADGSELYYADGLSIRRIPVDPARLRELADDLLTRDFLPDECARYGTPERCEVAEG